MKRARLSSVNVRDAAASSAARSNCACCFMTGALVITGVSTKLGSLLIDTAGFNLVLMVILAVVFGALLGTGLPPWRDCGSVGKRDAARIVFEHASVRFSASRRSPDRLERHSQSLFFRPPLDLQGP